MEQSEESSGEVRGKTEDLVDGVGDIKDGGEGLIGGCKERSRTHIDVKEEQADEGDEILSVRVNNEEESRKDDKNSPVIEKNKTRVSTYTNSPSRSNRRPPAAEIAIKSGQNRARHVRSPKQSRQPRNDALKELKATTEEREDNEKEKKCDGKKRTVLTQDRAIIQDSFSVPGARATHDQESQFPFPY